MKYLKRFNESILDEIRNRTDKNLSDIKGKIISGNKFCHECGYKLDKNDTFCGGCGERQEMDQQPNNKKYFNGILTIHPFGVGSKSEGLRAYLEYSGKNYILYRKGEYEGNVSFFEPYKDKKVSIFGELQKDKFIMVKNIKVIK